MKAVTYQGAHEVRVEHVPDPVIEHPQDILLRVTATAICGSDLHLYRGKVDGVEEGDIPGHEFMGIVEDVGPEVTAVRKGDRVVVPFTIACGHCFYCERKLFAGCETTNEGEGFLSTKRSQRPGAGMFGYGRNAGGYRGGQAEYVRVPMANTGPLVLPPGIEDEKVLFLSDILPTGYQAAVNGEIGPGRTVAVFGAGPVGMMAVASAHMLGAQRIFLVDHHPYRLQFAKDTWAVEPVDFSKVDDPAAYIVEHTQFRGVDAAIDAVGFEAKGSFVDKVLSAVKAEGGSPQVLRWAIGCTRRGGVVSVPGVYAGALQGLPFGDAFDKGLTIRTGTTHVQRFMPELLTKIQSGELKPEVIVTHRLALEDAARGYRLFDQKEEECRKVVLTPGLPGQAPQV